VQVHLGEVLVGMAVLVGAAWAAMVAVLETRQALHPHRVVTGEVALVPGGAAVVVVAGQPQLVQLEQRQ